MRSVIAIVFLVLLVSPSFAINSCQRCGRGCGSIGYCSGCQKIPDVAKYLKELKAKKDSDIQQKKREEQADREIAAAQNVIGVCEVCRRKIRRFERDESLILKNPNKHPPKNSKRQKCWCYSHFCHKHRRPFKKDELCSECISEAEQLAKEQAEREAEEMRNAEKEKLLLEKHNSLLTQKQLADVKLLMVIVNYYQSQAELCSVMKICPIHKWSEGFSPVFVGDYYTEQARTSYFQSKMAAIQAHQKCSCYGSDEKKLWSSIVENRKIIETLPIPFNDVERDAAELKKRLDAVLESKLIVLSADARVRLKALRSHLDMRLRYLALQYEWQTDRSQFDK